MLLYIWSKILKSSKYALLKLSPPPRPRGPGKGGNYNYVKTKKQKECENCLKIRIGVLLVITNQKTREKRTFDAKFHENLAHNESFAWKAGKHFLRKQLFYMFFSFWRQFCTSIWLTTLKSVAVLWGSCDSLTIISNFFKNN